MQKVKIGFVPSTWESWDGSAYTGKLAGKMRARCLEAFAKIPGLEIVAPSEELTQDGCVGTVEEGMKAADLFNKENVQGLIIGNMNFGFETAIGAMLSKIRKDMPVLHFATRSGPFSPQGNRANDTWCGQFMTCSTLKRRGFKFEHIITCNPEDEIFASKVETFTRACNAISRFVGMRILQVGTRPTGFESEFFSEEGLMRNFSQVLVPVDLATAYERMDALTAENPEVQRIAKEIRGGADLITDETPNSIVNQARFERMLVELAEEYHCNTIASSCWESLQHRYGIAAWGTEKDIKPFVDPKFENNVILTGTEFLTMNTRPKIPANARNLNCCIIGSSGSGKTRFWLTPQLLQAHSSYVVVDPKGGVLGQVGGFLQKRGYKIKVFNSIDFSKSMHYNPLAYIRNEADILKFVDALISNTKGEGKEGDPFWTKSETLLYCALIAYIIFEGPAEDRNMNTLVDMISGMEVKEDDEDFMNAVDYMFAGLEKRKPDCFAVKQYKKYKLASGDVCSK